VNFARPYSQCTPLCRPEILGLHYTNFLSYTYQVAIFGFYRFPCRLDSFRPGFAVIVCQRTLQKQITPSHSCLSPMSSQKSPITLDSYAQLALLT